MNLPIILASSSPSRLHLLKQIGITPSAVIPADIDESQKKGEVPKQLAQRLAFEKASLVSSSIEEGIIIGADTVSVVGRSVLHKASNADEVYKYLKLLSNRRHDVFTGVCIIRKTHQETKKLMRIVKSTLKFKNLSDREIELYCQSGQGIGKAGGCSLSGYAESFVTYLSGSFSNIIGLPLYETTLMLRALNVNNFDITLV